MEDATTSFSESITTMLESGASSVQSYAQEGLTVMLPYALSIMGLYLGVRLAINFFRSVAN